MADLPAVPPTVDELQALLPWAHIEAHPYSGELVIYTGILECDPETGEDGPFWLKGMTDE